MSLREYGHLDAILYCLNLLLLFGFYRLARINIFDDSLAIFAGQSIYVELLWRYLESRLSSSPDVVKFFNKLVLNLLCLQRGLFGVRRTMYNSEDEIHKMTPLIQSMYITSKKIDVMDCDDTNERISIE